MRTKECEICQLHREVSSLYDIWQSDSKKVPEIIQAIHEHLNVISSCISAESESLGDKVRSLEFLGKSGLKETFSRNTYIKPEIQKQASILENLFDLLRVSLDTKRKLVCGYVFVLEFDNYWKTTLRGQLYKYGLLENVDIEVNYDVRNIFYTLFVLDLDREYRLTTKFPPMFAEIRDIVPKASLPTLSNEEILEKYYIPYKQSL